jgi:hypothetical protein
MQRPGSDAGPFSFSLFHAPNRVLRNGRIFLDTISLKNRFPFVRAHAHA